MVYDMRKNGPIADIINARVILAPMSGVTDIPSRMIARKFGCRFAFTEMIDVNGIIYNNRKTLKLMETIPEDRPLGVQIVGQDEKKILRAAKICEDTGFEVLDLNAGCPAKKIIKGGKGAALLKDPVKLGKIVRMLVRALSIPVMVKMRSGWDRDNMNYLEVARVVESEGASAICVHARTKAQMYRGKAKHDITREIKENTGIPVIASGNIFTPDDVEQVFRTTGCDAIAIARGALGRPWIFDEVYRRLDGKRASRQPSFDRIKKVISEHFSLSLEYFDEWRVFPRMYKHMTWYLSPFKELGGIMKAYGAVKSPESFHDFMRRLSLDENNRLSLSV